MQPGRTPNRFSRLPSRLQPRRALFPFATRKAIQQQPQTRDVAGFPILQRFFFYIEAHVGLYLRVAVGIIPPSFLRPDEFESVPVH